MKIELPKDWNNVTIDQFQKMSKIKHDESDGIDGMIEMISILSSIERQRLYDVSYCDIIKIWNVLGWVSELNFIKDIVSEFTIKGITYVANLDVRQMSAGQLIDLKHYLKDGATIDNIHNVLSIFYIPKGKKYNEDSVIDIGELFQNELSISIAYPLQVFFCERLSKWKSLTLDYTRISLMTTKKKRLINWLTKRTASMRNGDGL